VHLEKWFQSLADLTTRLTCGTNHSKIVQHAASLHSWVQDLLLPHVSGLQTENEILIAENNLLKAKIEKMQDDYDDLRDLCARQRVGRLENRRAADAIFAAAQEMYQTVSSSNQAATAAAELVLSRWREGGTRQNQSIG
jgi:cell division protein FtsB